MDLSSEDETVIPRESFFILQADYSMTIFDDEQYIGQVGQAWDVTEPAHLSVTQKDLETLIASIRFNLLKSGTEKHTEEFVLREVFR